MAFASVKIIQLMNKIKPPYNINQATQELALQALDNMEQVNEMILLIADMREALVDVLLTIPGVIKVYPSDANFLLIKIKEAKKVYEFLLTRGVVVRDRSNVQLCDDCLRVTIGTEKECAAFVDGLIAFANAGK
jgi:histidinol-phosphate aminotransferase